MIGDAMIITVSVCLFIYLGLFNAIAGILKRLVPVNPEKIGRLSGKLKCSKCISFLAHAGLQHCMRMFGYSLHPCFFSVRFGRTMD